MKNNISIDKLDRASCENLNICNQKGWVAVEWMPEKGHSRVVAIARTKQHLIYMLEDLSDEEEEMNDEFEMILSPSIIKPYSDAFWAYDGGREDEEADLASNADAYDICNDSDEDEVIFAHGTFKTHVEK